MENSASNDTSLLVLCPSCRQRFKVSETLRDRTVECGGCEHRFRINDDVIVRTRKFYPGERSGPQLTRFNRFPASVGQTLGSAKPSRFGNPPDQAIIHPVSPLKILVATLGIAATLVVAMLLIFSGGTGSMLDGVGLEKRLLMAAFISGLGICALVFANPQARGKAIVISGLLAIGVISLPFFFKTGSGQTPLESSNFNESPPLPATNPTQDSLSTLRSTIGTGPLEAEIERLNKDGSRKTAVGLWLRGLSDSQRYLARDYILRITKAESTSHIYPRDNEDYLFVLTGSPFTLEECAKSISMIGKTVQTYPELSVAEIRINPDTFTEGPMEKLINQNDPAFYDLNKRELESIDNERARRATQRLANVEPKIFRTDVARKLTAMLSDDSIDFKDSVCSALIVWADTPGPAGKAALEIVKKRIAKQQDVSEDMIKLIVQENNPDILPILDELWMKAPSKWELIYGKCGSIIEPTVIRRFSETQGILRYSAAKILGEVGSEASISVLNSARNETDPELRATISQSLEAISKRLQK